MDRRAKIESVSEQQRQKGDAALMEGSGDGQLHRVTLLKALGRCELSRAFRGLPLTYAATPRVVSGDVTRAAAHQIALSLWWLISFVSVPLSLAGQSLLPRRLSADPALARRTALAIARLGAYCAALCAGFNALIPTVWAGAFSKSPDVLAALGSVTATAAAAQAALSFATALDGVFLGCGWRGHYVRTVALSTCAAGAVFVAASRCGGSLVGVWLGLFLFGAVRAACHAAALPLLLRKLAGDAKLE